ncbi:MAG: hypothetical protein J6U10_06195, partial [Lachnospiraceae bacterium]|nr:hypothetical protein [Lachnospiraceae bacterium]
SKYKEHYFNTEIVKTYESEFEWWKNEVYPTLPDDQLKEKESEESYFKLAWWTKKHSVEEQEEYEKVFEKYVDFLKASYQFIRAKHDDLNKEIAKEQIERIKNLGIYVAEERESGLTVFITTKQLKCLTAPEGVGFNISWARQKTNDSFTD